MLDQILVLDALKAFKASLIDDIVMLQHAQQQLLASGLLSSDAEDSSISDLVDFLSDRWWCVKVLYGSIKQVNYHHRVMGRIVQFLSDSLSDKVCYYPCTGRKTWHQRPHVWLAAWHLQLSGKALPSPHV